MAGQRTLRHGRGHLQCGEICLELGVYVLGTAGAADRRAVGAHLASCADCRGELADLVGLPRLLSRVSADEAERLSGAE
jgi:anti-sigma factor RsiW